MSLFNCSKQYLQHDLAHPPKEIYFPASKASREVAKFIWKTHTTHKYLESQISSGEFGNYFPLKY